MSGDFFLSDMDPLIKAEREGAERGDAKAERVGDEEEVLLAEERQERVAGLCLPWRAKRIPLVSLSPRKSQWFTNTGQDSR